MTSEDLPKLACGAVVTLNSGGPAMTVVDTDYDPEEGEDASPAAVSVDVSWMDQAGQNHEATFPAACLNIVDVSAIKGQAP